MVPRNSTKKLIQKHTFPRGFLKYLMALVNAKRLLLGLEPRTT